MAMPKMKCSLFPAGVAALFLATGAAHPTKAGYFVQDTWITNCRYRIIEKRRPDDAEGPENLMSITPEDLPVLEKEIKNLKKCVQFRECVERRGTKWPDGHAWVYPPQGSKLGPKRPDGTQSVEPPKNRPKHCYNPRFED
jgi:hypothetical protein